MAGVGPAFSATGYCKIQYQNLPSLVVCFYRKYATLPKCYTSHFMGTFFRVDFKWLFIWLVDLQIIMHDELDNPEKNMTIIILNPSIFKRLSWFYSLIDSVPYWTGISNFWCWLEPWINNWAIFIHRLYLPQSTCVSSFWWLWLEQKTDQHKQK